MEATTTLRMGLFQQDPAQPQSKTDEHNSTDNDSRHAHGAASFGADATFGAVTVAAAAFGAVATGRTCKYAFIVVGRVGSRGGVWSSVSACVDTRSGIAAATSATAVLRIATTAISCRLRTRVGEVIANVIANVIADVIANVIAIGIANVIAFVIANVIVIDIGIVIVAAIASRYSGGYTAGCRLSVRR
jgi:hypothetical protein